MTSRIGSVALAAILAFSASYAHAQGEGKTNVKEEAGLTVGAAAPKFTLKDQTGKGRSLDELLAKGKVALVFYRSADW